MIATTDQNGRETPQFPEPGDDPREVAEAQRQIAAALTDAQAKLADISATATQAIAAKTQIADAQAVIATKSDHIQKAQEHADKVRGDLDRLFTAATQQLTATEAKRTGAESAAEDAEELLEEIRTTKGAVDTEAASAADARKISEDSAEVSKKLADKAASVEERLGKYEKRLAEVDAQCAQQLKTIESLLPGATSAGLAHAFDQRRQSFLKPQGRWQILFVCSVLAIVLLAITGLWHVYKSGVVPGWNELLLLWLARLPVAGALVWLAMYASRESALAKRLEEDYGYKAAIAFCFEGFRKQMAEVGEEVATDSQLAALCDNTLKTIASPPGRIYEKHPLTVSPADEIRQVAKIATDTAQAIKPGTKQG